MSVEFGNLDEEDVFRRAAMRGIVSGNVQLKWLLATGISNQTPCPTI